MKRFTVFLSLFSVLAFWAAFQTWFVREPSVTEDKGIAPVYDATGEMLKAIHAGDGYVIPVTGAEERIVPVYDATGAMLEAINPSKKVFTFPAYDATGAMLDALNPNKPVITLPAYDATAAMLDAIHP